MFVFLILSMGAEFAFTTYLGVFDGANLVGHLLRLLSYFILYGALLRTGLQHPFDLVFRDLKQKETELLRRESDLQKIFDISPFPIVITSLSDSRLAKANQAALEMFEISSIDLDKHKGLDFYANREDRSKILQKIRTEGKIQNELLELKTESGKCIWGLVNVIPIDFDGEQSLLVGVADITDQKRIQEDLQYLSSHDALTGLYNRTYFEAEMNRLQRGRRFPISIVVLDIDDLKVINDTYGHDQGDKMLQTLASLVEQILRSEEVFARIGGDEFAILLPRADEAVSRLVISRLKDQLDKHAKQDGNQRIRVSIGLGVADLNDELDEALRQADANMYADKNVKKGNTRPRH